MTDFADKKREMLARLSKVMIEDLLAASDERIVAETREDGQDPAAIAAATRALFEKVVATSRKALLAVAKAQVIAERRRAATVVPLDPAAARERLARLLAQEPNFTMAARKATSGELTDDEVFSLLEDLDELGIKPKDPDGGS
jgi:hypothetical protein